MQRRRFGRTDLQISELTFGGGWVGGLLIRSSEQIGQAVLDRAIDEGINWIDTAALYGDGVSETAIGGWLAGVAKGRRPHISTKFNIDTLAGDHEGQIRRSVEASLGRLRVESVPLLILHSRIVKNTTNDNRNLSPEQILTGGGIADIMDQLRKEGICDWIGITGLGDPEALALVVDSGRFDAAQIYYNMLNPTAVAGGGPGWNTTDFNGLLKKCTAHDMGVMGIRIFAAGHLAAHERHGREIPITANADNAAEEARAQAALEALGGRYGTSAQAALRFGLASPLLSTIVVGIGEPWHLDQAFEATRMGPLPIEGLRQLEKVRADHPAFRQA
jgi:D-threo-aldose 1-dehydrogenase